MAKILVAGNAVVITSAVKFKDLEVVTKYRPEALTLYGGEDGKTPIFAVAIGKGEISQYGISFSDETRDNDKFATLTLANCLDGVVENVADYVADKYGAAITYLNEIEETIPNVLEDIKSSRDAVKRNITIAQ